MPGPLFVGAALALALELLELRIFSYALDPQLVYSAISAALLGLGAGAMAVVRWPALASGDAPTLHGACLGAFSLSAVGTLALFARLSPWAGFGPGAALLFALLLLPYLALGVLLAAATARPGIDIGRAYLANLLGSALGAVAIQPLIGPLGAERLSALIALAGAAASVALGRRAQQPASPGGPQAPARWVLGLGALACAASAGALAGAERVFAFQPDPRDLYGVARAALRRAKVEGEPQQEYSRWDPVSRVEVYSFPGEFARIDGQAAFKLFVQDGGAGSMLVGPEAHAALFDRTVYGGAYLLRPAPERALVVGLGGAPDILAALHHGARRVTGVEINASAIEVVRERYAPMLGGPYQRPEVSVVHGDGRSFLDRTAERYDVIQMTGADTYAAGSGGAFMFSENYLYTEEAFRRAIEALAPGGVLSIIRFGLEPVRVVATEIAALRSLGVRQPEQHIAVLSQGIWVNVLLSREPLPPEATARLRQAVAGRAPGPRIPVYDALGFGLASPMELLYAPGYAPPNLYSTVLTAAAAGGEAQALSTLALDFSPVNDDRPFFFQHLTLGRLGALFRPGAGADYYARGLRAHLGFLLLSALLGAALTLGPLRGKRPEGALSYFGALGLGYLFVELSVLQKGSLFLGHPTYSATLVILALLLGSGAGAAWSSRSALPPEQLGRRAALLLVPALLLLHPLLRWLLGALLPLPFAARVAALSALLLPLGFAMGVPFPSGLRALRGERELAWAMGVNSFASVLASLLAVPLAMFSGFSVVGALAAGLYALAALSAPRLVGGGERV